MAEQKSLDPRWLDWAQRLQALAQTGLSYGPHEFDRERYEKIQEIAQEMLTAHANGDPAQIDGLFNAQAGHATPKVDVRGVVFRENKILLVREMLDGGRWTLPGGWADINETPSQAVAREVYEEAGYHTCANKVLAVYDRRLHNYPPTLFHIYKVFIRCDLLENAPDASYDKQTGASYLETTEATFFAENAIPNDLSTGRVTHAQIARFFEHNRNPDLPTDFD